MTVDRIPSYLLCDIQCEYRISTCDGRHVGSVKPNPNIHPVHWYITMGHAGFNSDRNNGDGYPSAKAARAAIAYYNRKRQAKGGLLMK